MGAEDALALRIARERKSRGWSYETLAKRMTEAGCPINMTGVYRIEKGEPRRRINVDELVALSRIWSIPVERLLSPPTRFVAGDVESAQAAIREALSAIEEGRQP